MEGDGLGPGVSAAPPRWRNIPGKRPVYPPPLLDFARALLDDGAGYGETARTTGIPAPSLQARWPGMGWTRQQVADYNALRATHKYCCGI